MASSPQRGPWSAKECNGFLCSLKSPEILPSKNIFPNIDTMSDVRARTMAKITTLIEAGLNPEEIARNLQEEASKTKRIEFEGESDDEIFPDEIKVIAQALAFRNANFDDLDAIKLTLKSAYRCEIEGPESFRKGSVMNDEMVESLLRDSSYSWILVEAPNGQGVEEDGKLLGVCCFSTDGVSKRNGAS